MGRQASTNDGRAVSAASLTDLSTIGQRPSVLGAKAVGFMRVLGATSAALAGATAALLAAAHLESRFPTVRRLSVPIPARPGLEPITILHISDLHMWAGQQFIIDFLHRVARDEHFDFVVSTGDNLSDESGLEPLLKALEPLAGHPGAFVLGSNDYYRPAKKRWTSYLDPTHHTQAAKRAVTVSPDLPWLRLVETLTRWGWLDMSNQAATVDVPPICSLVGVDDPHILRDRVPEPAASWALPEAWRLALSHAPYKRTLDAFAQMGADLVLCGHTHGGQVRLPGLGALANNTDIPNFFSRGLYWWQGRKNSTWVNISAGLGTSKFARVRLFCRPEVSLLTLVPTAD